MLFRNFKIENIAFYTPAVRGLVLFSVLSSLFSASIASAQSATLSLSPASGSYASGKTFTVQVMADSAQPYNSGGGVIAFDKDLLSVTSVAKTSSAFSLWAVEPAFDNAAGKVSFEGGNASPVSGKKNLISITFKALKTGSAKVSFASGSVLAADGKGTDIAGEKQDATYEITAQEAPPPPPPPVAASGGQDDADGGGLVPETPEISSSSHSEENKWYNSVKANFNWELPDDVTAARLTLDVKPDTIPTTNYDPAISEKEFGDLTEGVMYFHLRYKNDAGWGPSAHRMIRIDKTPPEKFALEAVPDPAKEGEILLKFMATDTLSGMERYALLIDGASESKIGLAEVKEEGYVASGIIPGEHAFLVKAFDKAGNSSESEVKATIPGTPPKPAAEEPEEKPTDWRLIGDIGLIAFIAFLVGYLFYERRAFRHEKFIVKREADEVRDANANIFGALREEVSESIGLLYQRPNPSAQDREVTQRINEALDMSEEMLAKEIEDVRKLLT